MDVKTLLQESVQEGASDVIFSVGAPPTFRIAGKLRPQGDVILTGELSQKIVLGILNDNQREKFITDNSCNLTLSIKNVGRFRVTAYKQKGMISAVFRVIAQNIPDTQEIGLPQGIIRLTDSGSGLLLITGPSGNGVTTTISSIINHINKTRKCHIITIEQPVEFTHNHGESVIDQIEVGRDSASYVEALSNIPFQNPEVVVIGELSDLQTMASAIKIAGTGRLVIAAMKTNGAAHTVDTIIQGFPEYQQQQIRNSLSSCLLGICSQRLVPCANNNSQVAAFEFLVNHEGIKDLIMQDKLFMFEGAIRSGGKMGMISFEASLKNLLDNGTITTKTFSIFTGKALESQKTDNDRRVENLEKQLYDKNITIRKMAETELKKLRDAGNEDAIRILEEFGRYYITNFEENKISGIKN